jgi:hypothetical protein
MQISNNENAFSVKGFFMAMLLYHYDTAAEALCFCDFFW